jgi:hypothetical protein
MGELYLYLYLYLYPSSGEFKGRELLEETSSHSRN